MAEFPSVEEIRNMKYVGSGSFSYCYERTDNSVYILTRDVMKKCLASDAFPKSELFPKIRFAYHDISGTDVYIMPKYNVYGVPASLNAEHRDLYDKLDKITGCAYSYDKPESFNSKYWHEKFSRLDVKEEFKAALVGAIDACAKYGNNTCFDFGHGNIAHKDGKLILLDCFFLKGQPY